MRPSPPALDAEPGRWQARGAGTPTAGGETEAARSAHVALPPHLPGGPSAGGLFGAPATGGPGRRWGDVAALRTRPRSQSPGLVGTAGTRSVPGNGRAAGLYPEARRPPETVRHARAGRYNCPVGDRLDLVGYLGQRLRRGDERAESTRPTVTKAGALCPRGCGAISPPGSRIAPRPVASRWLQPWTLGRMPG
jgi:hypothetical protein